MTRFRFEDFIFDTEEPSLTQAGEPVPIRPKTAELLHYILSHREQLLTKQAILDHVWQDTHVTEAVLFQTISDLRKVVGQTRAKIYIENVKRKGYRWAIEDTENLDETPSLAEDPHTLDSPDLSSLPETTTTTTVVVERPEEPIGPKTSKNKKAALPFWLAIAAVIVLSVAAVFYFNRESTSIETTPSTDFIQPSQQLLTMVFGHTQDDALERTAQRIGEQVVTWLNAKDQFRVQLSQQEITNDIMWSAEGTSLRTDFARNLAKQGENGFALISWIEPADNNQLSVDVELYDRDGMRLKEQLIQPDMQAASNWISNILKSYFSVLDYWNDRGMRLLNEPQAAYRFALGQVALRQGSPEAAYAILESLQKDIGHRDILTLMMARAEIHRGNIEEGEALTRSVEVLGDDDTAILTRITQCVNNITLARRRGEYEQALEHAYRAIELSEQVDHTIERGLALNNAGNVLRELNRMDEAEQLFRETLEIYSNTGHQMDLPTVYLNLGNVYFGKGQYEDAISEYEHAIALHDQIGQPWRSIGPLLNTGAVLNHLDKHEEALTKLNKAKKLADERRDHRLLTQVHINFGNVASRQQQYQKAVDHYLEAKQHAQDYGHYDLVYTAAYNTALAAINGELYDQVKPELDYLWQNKGPNRITVSKMFGYFYHNIGEQELAIKWLEDTKAKDEEWDAEDEETLQLAYAAAKKQTATPTQ